MLIEGRPGAGKTTVARRLIDRLHERGLAVAGFTTEEIREAGRRVGFAVEDVDGRRAILAGTRLPGPPRVGRYGVDVAAFERIALPALGEGPEAQIVVIDELGKMELHSRAFREAVARLFDRQVHVVATVHRFRDPFTDALKRRPGVEVMRVTEGNRDELAGELADRLFPSASR
jgi:nucleoside-triphosphatase